MQTQTETPSNGATTSPQPNKPRRRRRRPPKKKPTIDQLVGRINDLQLEVVRLTEWRKRESPFAVMLAEILQRQATTLRRNMLIREQLNVLRERTKFHCMLLQRDLEYLKVELIDLLA